MQFIFALRETGITRSIVPEETGAASAGNRRVTTAGDRKAAGIEFLDAAASVGEAVPQTSDKRYYTQFVTAPYSERVDGYLFILLGYPRGAAEFRKDFDALVKEFDKHLREKSKQRSEPRPGS